MSQVLPVGQVPAGPPRPSGLTPKRALHRPRRADPRLVVGGLLTLVGVLGGALFWSGASEGQAVLVAARDLPVGTRLQPGDLAVVRVRVPDASLRTLVPAAEAGALVGHELAEPAHAQQLLGRALLATRPALRADLRAMTVPVAPERTPGTLLRPGDAVLVLVTPRPPAQGGAEVVLPRAPVYAIGYDERATVGGPVADGRTRRGPVASLTLLVTEGQALQLAQARARGDLDLALLPAESPTTPDAGPSEPARQSQATGPREPREPR
jgi:Flp pilus assembly protein CpaB